MDFMTIYGHKCDPTPRYYVYFHHTLDGELFYVGKGTGRRAYDSRKRNKFWKNKAQKGYNVTIFANNLTEEQAFIEEGIWLSKLGDRLTNIIINPGWSLNDTKKHIINRKKSMSLKLAWKHGKIKRRTYEGNQNPFYHKKHTDITKEKLKRYRYSPIECYNIKTNEKFIVSGTRNAQKLTGCSRGTIKDLILNKRNFIKVEWRFKKL